MESYLRFEKNIKSNVKIGCYGFTCKNHRHFECGFCEMKQQRKLVYENYVLSDFKIS